MEVRLKRTISSLLDLIRDNATSAYLDRVIIEDREYSASLLRGHLNRLASNKVLKVIQKFEGTSLVIISDNPPTKTIFPELDKKWHKEVKE